MKKRRYTITDKASIIKLVERNYSDADIVKKTGFGRGFITMTTTNYWKDKMSKSKNIIK